MSIKTSLSMAGISSLFLTFGSLPVMAVGGFTGAYDPSNFTFSSDPSGAGNKSDDLNITNAGSGEVILYGSDNANNSLGTGITATNTWSISINSSRAGTVSFNWSFESFTNDGDDIASYFVNTNFFTLATGNGTVQSGASPISLTLQEGDTFGFRVSTATNNGGEGILTVSDFQATPVPLESDALPILLGLTFMGGGMWLKRRLNSRKSIKLR